MYIKNFISFVKQELLNEEALITYRQNFIDILNRMKSPVAKAILTLNFKDLDFASTQIQLSEKDDEISFANPKAVKWRVREQDLQGWMYHGPLYDHLGLDINLLVDQISVGAVGKIEQIITDREVSSMNSGDRVTYFITDDGRKGFISFDKLEPIDAKKQQMSVGRFAQRILTQAKTQGFDFNFSQKEIADFVDEFKAKVSIAKNKMDYLRMVKGEDIRKYYQEQKYTKLNTGPLHNSCMRYPDCQDYLDVYVENPEVCSLLILMSDGEDDRIEARALVWSLIDGRTFMDRIYYSDQSQINLFKEYAVKQGWIFRRQQGVADQIVDQTPGQEASDQGLAVQLENYEFGHYPYMDTLYKYDEREKVIHNGLRGYRTDYTLTSASGHGPFSGCEICNGEGYYECSECEGGGRQNCSTCDGRQNCQNCEGDGEFDCRYCDGSGEVTCEDCDEGFVDCDTCGGDGKIDGDDCEDCNGEGKFECTTCEGWYNKVECDDCEGSGNVDCGRCSGSGECRECGGTGREDCEYCDGDGTVECPECN